MIHVTIQQLSSFLDRHLADASAELVRTHVDACTECEAKLGNLERIDGTLTRALTHDPGGTFDEEMADRVARAIQALSRSVADTPVASHAAAAVMERAPAPRPPSPAARSVSQAAAPAITKRTPTIRTAPRAALTVASTPAPPPRAAGTGTARPVPSAPPARSSRGPKRLLTTEPEPKRGSSLPAWTAVLLLATIAGSAGVVVSQSSRVMSWIDSQLGLTPEQRARAREVLASVEAAAPTNPDESPGATVDSAIVDPPSTAPDAAIAPSNDKPGRPPTMDEDDERFDDREPVDRPDEGHEPTTMRADEVLADPTAADSVAGAYEALASRYEKELERMGGRPEQVLLRRQLADARYQAWAVTRTRDRAEAARAAIKSYLLFAPSGPEREDFAARLTRLDGR